MPRCAPPSSLWRRGSAPRPACSDGPPESIALRHAAPPWRARPGFPLLSTRGSAERARALMRTPAMPPLASTLYSSLSSLFSPSRPTHTLPPLWPPGRLLLCHFPLAHFPQKHSPPHTTHALCHRLTVTAFCTRLPSPPFLPSLWRQRDASCPLRPNPPALPSAATIKPMPCSLLHPSSQSCPLRRPWGGGAVARRPLLFGGPASPPACPSAFSWCPTTTAQQQRRRRSRPPVVAGCVSLLLGGWRFPLLLWQKEKDHDARPSSLY